MCLRDSCMTVVSRMHPCNILITHNSVNTRVRSLSLSLTLPLSHSPTHSISLSVLPSRSLSRTLSHTYTHTHQHTHAHSCACHRCVSMTSTCVFPDKIAYPITEDQIHDGAPHSSNEGYAYAKVRVALQHTATHCDTLQHTATHCNTLQHAATFTMVPPTLRMKVTPMPRCVSICNTLQHATTHCNIHDGALHSSNEGYAYGCGLKCLFVSWVWL